MKPVSNAIVMLAFALMPGSILHAQAEKTPLAKRMSAINTAFKIVGKQVDDASKNASTLEQLLVIETNAKAAMALSPKKKSQIAANAQAKFQGDYETEMKSMLATVAKLRASLKAGKNAEASALVDSLKTQQREAHKEFRGRVAGDPPDGLRP